MLRARSLVLGAAGFGALFTLLFSAGPWLPLAVRSPSLHLALETAAGVIALVATCLMFGRLRVSPRLGDLALASALAVFATTNLLLAALPAALSATPSDRLSTWALLAGRLLGAGLFAYVVAREIGRYWRAAAGAAVLEERRRMARDLHDGLAQELAFIVTQSKRLANRGDESVGHICVAAERALDESRRAIVALTRPVDEPLCVVLADVAHEVAYRVGLRLELDLQDVSVGPEAREALVRIVREAVTNAARHGQASVARIELSNGAGLRLRVADDGIGFDQGAVQAGSHGFGLRSIEERTAALGGAVHIESRPSGGTAIEVVIP